MAAETLVPRLLKFKSQPVKKVKRKSNFVPLVKKQPNEKVVKRVVASTAMKILDAPDLVDDYYLNLLDWSPLNVLAISLKGFVYQQNIETLQT